MGEFKGLRDIVMLTIGGALCLSQIIIQLQGGEPSVAMLTAGAGLLAGYPLIKVGDRRGDDHEDRQNPGEVSGGGRVLPRADGSGDRDGPVRFRGARVALAAGA